FLLAAEAASGLRLDDAHLLRRKPQDHRKRPVNVVGALKGSVQCHAAVLGNGDDAVALDVQLLLVAAAVRALDDAVGLLEAAGDVSLLDRDSLEGPGTDGRIEDRFGRAVFN